MFGGIATEDGLGRQHLYQTAQATHESDLAGLAIFVRFPASSFREQLHFGPLEGDPHLVEQACCHPGQGH